MASSNTYAIKDVKGVPMGLAVQFEDELDDGFPCCTCSALTPMGLKDGKGHVFCLACTRAHTDSDNQFSCSQCGWQSLTSNMTTNTQDWTTLLEKSALCPNIDAACNFRGAFKDVLIHYKLCGLKGKVQCSLCGSLQVRKNLGDHVKEDCPKRVQGCSFCPEDMEADEIEIHEAACRYRPAQCPHCEEDFETLAQLEDEHFPSCGYMPVACSYKPLGCTILAPRDDLDEHDFGNHGNIIVKEICDLKETNKATWRPFPVPVLRSKKLEEGMQDVKTTLAQLENKANVLSDYRSEVDKTLEELKKQMEAFTRRFDDFERRLNEVMHSY
ncbi:TNF receptor-associated factor 5-like isoform X1 [Haemaphysalis longicornis]